MKSLKEYLQEDAALNGTPANTMGMGNPMAPGPAGEPGSEPMVTEKPKKKKCERCGKDAECEECKHCKK